MSDERKAVRPLVFRLHGAEDHVVWVQHGRAWMLDQPRATWAPLTDAPVVTAGRVLTQGAVEALVSRVGGPT